MLKKRIWLLIVSLCMVFPFSACWDMNEINDRVFILGIGVDRASDGEYEFTFQTAQFLGESAYSNISITSDSLSRAVRELEKSSTNISFEHLCLVVLSDGAAKADFYSLLDYLFREGTIRRQCQIAVSPIPAKELLLKKTGNAGAAVYAAQVLESSDSSQVRLATMTLNRLYIVKTVGEGFYIPTLSTTDAEAVSGTDAPCFISVSGAYCYNNVGYSGMVSKSDAELIRLFSNGQANGIIESANIDGTVIRYKIESSSCDKKVNLKDDRLFFNIDLNIECSLIENPSDSEVDSDAIEKSLYSRIYPLTVQSRNELGASILGLERTARQHYHSWYLSNHDSWDSLYNSSDIKLTINCTVRRVGSVT